MKILIIGGTGTISSAITRQLAAEGHDLWLLNRGNRNAEVPQNVKIITGDINEHPEEVAAKLSDDTFDAVCEFIGFVPEQVERDVRMFTGRTRQYVYFAGSRFASRRRPRPPRGIAPHQRRRTARTAPRTCREAPRGSAPRG